MRMKIFFAILLGKLTIFFSRLFNLGNGSTWPGHLAFLINRNFIEDILKKNFQKKIIIISGTNGKTTTVELIKFILGKKGIRVISNEEGANLLNGMASSIIKNCNFFGNFSQEVIVWETDEFNLPLIIKRISPDGVILLNLFRDQLDRYGEVNTIAHRWFNALKEIPNKTKIYLNGDDPQLMFLGKKLKKEKEIYFFGLDQSSMNEKEIPHDADSSFCPICGTKLIYNRIAYSHLGDFFCSRCRFKRETVENFKNKKICYPLSGLFMKYNTHAVILFLMSFFNIEFNFINKNLRLFRPKFGRQEKIKIGRKDGFIFLVKNPASFNQAIKTVIGKEKKEKIDYFLILNDRIPDGRDISWIWDVDFEKLSKAGRIYIAGDRSFEMALRLKYDLIEEKKLTIFNDLKSAINYLSQVRGKRKIYIFPNYSAMLELRKLLVGRKFL